MTYTYIYIALAVINIAAFILVGVDKQKAIAGDPRVREVYFFFWSIFFASLGVLLGMFVFHHKTRKWYFPVGLGLLLVEQLVLIWLLGQIGHISLI